MVSRTNFCELLASEIDRLDGLFNESPDLKKTRIDDPQLEMPGLAIVASRTTALRREYLAGIAICALANIELDVQATAPGLTVLANHSPQIFMRQMLAQMSKLKFETLDQCQLEDDDWPRLTSGVLILEGKAAVKESDDDHSDVDESHLRWESAIVSIVDLVNLISGSTRASTIIVENYHLINDVTNHPDAIRNLRNAATAAGIYLYIGCGLTHWHEVRTSGALYLSDLAESLTEAVHVADLITLLTPSKSGISTVVYDPRYSAPWRGSLITS